MSNAYSNLVIEGHKLKNHWLGRSPHSGGALVNPTVLVIHYTASGGASGRGDADFFIGPNARASAHFVVGRDGGIIQIVECDRKAWHAGVSVWKGRPNVNDFSIGIEVDNWGHVEKRADGTFRSYTGALVPAENVVHARHKNPSCPNEYWEAYSPVQIEAVIALTRALRAAYPSMTEIVGHEDIAPKRKTDPGPAFPWQHFRHEVEGLGNSDERIRTVSAQSLNVRGGPGTQFEIIGTLKFNAAVVEIAIEGDWSRIEYTTLLGGIREGWVFNHYLEG